ncbi:MAG: DUF839 domain-containing protein [Polyangiales bacterium]
MKRRQLLQAGLAGVGATGASWWAIGTALSGCKGSSKKTPIETPTDFGVLLDPDALGLKLPQGFSARIVAQSSTKPSTNSEYVWHRSPDGGAVFAASDGGWIYVSNCEETRGGVGALRFDVNGNVVDAYSILSGTINNCAGGATPWGTWLSCEEIPAGRVWECDPSGQSAAIVRPALGRFTHEAVAVDPDTMILYLTEDVPDGRFYRFVPTTRDASSADLSAGQLEVASVDGTGHVSWLAVPDPTGAGTPTRLQVSQSTAFNGGEGICCGENELFFSTKGDDRVWRYDTNDETIQAIYDPTTASNPQLSGVDNVTLSPSGKVLVAEDGGDMQIVAVDLDGTTAPIVQVVGQRGSEITGPAFDPSGTRLYFSSQRGLNEFERFGITYEVTGPFDRLGSSD